MRRPGYLGEHSGTLGTLGQPQMAQMPMSLARKTFATTKETVRKGLRNIPLLGLGKRKSREKIKRCYENICPPPNNWNLIPQFWPAITELQKLPTPEQQEAAAKHANQKAFADLKKLMDHMIARSDLAQQVLGADASKAYEASKKVKQIVTELKKLDMWAKKTGAPFVHAPMYPPHQHALFQAQQVRDDAYDPTLDEESSLDKITEPAIVEAPVMLAPPPPRRKGFLERIMDMLGIV